MPFKRANGVGLFYEVSGAGEPLVLVHGSWGDHHSWGPVVAPLSESLEVVVYDRRGHSQSERPAGQGSVHEDADDLAALIDALELGPAHVVANSFGAIVALDAASRRPEVFATLVAHEPPLLGMLAGTQWEPVLQEVAGRVGRVNDLLSAGDDLAGARLFVETVARGAGAWEGELTADLREVFIGNAPTFLDESRDPGRQRLDFAQLRRFDRPALLSTGTASPPFLIAVTEAIALALPRFEIAPIDGADHAPHQTTTGQYVDLVRRFVTTGRVACPAGGSPTATSLPPRRAHRTRVLLPGHDLAESPHGGHADTRAIKAPGHCSRRAA